MSVLVEVAIGLTFAYLLVSLIGTVVNELISSLLKLRARELRKGLENILDDQNVKQLFFKSPIFSMAGRASGWTGPSYIPSTTFVMTLLDVLDPKTSAADKRTMETISAAIDKMQESDLKRTLAELVRNSAGDIEAARAAIAAWFDQMMERLGGVYKRNLQTMSFVVAALLCISLNVDSIQMGRTLWFDSSMRQVIADRASSLVRDASNADELADLETVNRDLRPLPIGWDFSSPAFSSDWNRSFDGWLVKILGLLLSTFAVSLGAPFWFDLLNKFVRLRGAGAEPPPARQADTVQRPAPAH